MREQANNFVQKYGSSASLTSGSGSTNKYHNQSGRNSSCPSGGGGVQNGSGNESGKPSSCNAATTGHKRRLNQQQDYPTNNGKNQHKAKSTLQVRRTLRVKIRKTKPILGIAIEGGFNVSGQLLPRVVCVHVSRFILTLSPVVVIAYHCSSCLLSMDVVY